MPMYTYKCSCNETKTLKRHIDNRNDNVLCKCGNSMVRVISSPVRVWAPTRVGGQ